MINKKKKTYEKRKKPTRNMKKTCETYKNHDEQENRMRNRRTRPS